MVRAGSSHPAGAISVAPLAALPGTLADLFECEAQADWSCVLGVVSALHLGAVTMFGGRGTGE